MTARKGRGKARAHGARSHGRAGRATQDASRRAPDPPDPGLPEPRDGRDSRGGEPGQEREHVEDLLDEALMQTFPASDPVTLKACGSSQDPASAGADPVPRGTGPNDGHAGEAAPPR